MFDESTGFVNQGFDADGVIAGEALYEVTNLASYFLRSFPRELSDYDSWGDLLEADYVTDASEEARSLRHHRNRIYRELLLKPVFYRQEEYEAEKEMLNYIASEGTVVTVNADPGYAPAPVNGVIVLTKPLYGFPVVRILNGEKLTDGAAIDISPKPYFNGVRALIVDDEPMNLVVAEGLFREYGMITDTAESGQQSIEKYENGDYDVIFMDHMMPEMDGVEAMKHLKFIADGSFRHPVFIALTANALSGAKEMFIKEGFDGFIAKPVDIGEFERVMKSVLPESMISYEGRAE